jgi:hypothetical protein
LFYPLAQQPQQLSLFGREVCPMLSRQPTGRGNAEVVTFRGQLETLAG